MQSEAEAAANAYGCVLASAERHMNEVYGEPQLPEICETCAHFVQLGSDDQAELYRCIPDDVPNRHQLAIHLRLCLGVCRKAVEEPDEWMGVLYARDNPCDEWEERDE